MSNCCKSCEGSQMSGVMVPYRSSRPLRGTRYLAGGRLGALGTSTTVNLVGNAGLKVGSAVIGSAAAGAIGTAAGTAGGALFGAAAGSVVPVIGTVIGAVVGILTSKLFGHANYAAVYANIDNVRQLWVAYQGVAGQYVGRQYGWPELQQILKGAMVSGLFTGNGPPPGVQCTQAMISNKINACGTGQWVDDLIGVGPASGDQNPAGPLHPGTGVNNMLNLIGTGISQGVVDPITMADKVLIPGIETIARGKGNSSFSVSGSQNPRLYRQWLIDFSDYILSLQNPNLPAYYGTQNVQPLPSAAPPAAAPAPQPVVASNNPTPASSANVQSVTGLGVTITPAQGGTLVTAQGSWQFGGSNTPAGFPVYFNGSQVGGMFGVQMSVAAIPNMIRVVDAYGNAYVWSGTAWQQTVTAPTATAPPVVTTTPPAPITTAAGNVVPPPSIPTNPTPPAVAAAGGTVAPVDATAAYLAQLQQQGASQNQAMLAAIQQLQAQGMSAQAAQSTVAAAAPYASIPQSVAAPLTPDATPVAATAGLSSVPAGTWAIIGGAILVSFALARPKNRNIGKRRR